jgi:hypothetical protein
VLPRLCSRFLFAFADSGGAQVRRESSYRVRFWQFEAPAMCSVVNNYIAGPAAPGRPLDREPREGCRRTGFGV